MDVYEYNFMEELHKIMELSQTYNVIAMDTEFPGVNYPLPPNHEDKE